MTFAAIIGLVIGSIVIVFPGIPTGGFSIISSIITFILGFAIVTYFGKKSTFDPLAIKALRGFFMLFVKSLSIYIACYRKLFKIAE